MLTLQNVSFAHGNKSLLDNASVVLYEKQKIGIIGHNGCGKSTLFDLILKKIHPDTGEILLNSNLKISHLAQHIPDVDSPALDYVLSGDTNHQLLQERLANAEKMQNHPEVLACHAELELTSGYSKPAKAAAIMSGLGFSAEEQLQPVNSFSGGWRMRLNLGRCLMQPADLFLLDEPTNHLDMEAIFWLERWLKQLASGVLVISHDREFLDKFVTHIVHFDQQKITAYTGNYSQFERARAAALMLQQKTHEKQQLRINHLMSYVNRFRAKASKAKQAQSRLKLIDKIELVAQAQLDSPFSFSFAESALVGNPLLNTSQMVAGYSSKEPILSNIKFQLNKGDRVALLGPNGQGKSTFIKTLIGVIPALAGDIHHCANLKIGYYAQHQLEELNFNLSPLDTIQQLTPEAREQEIRDFLGGFNFIGNMAMTPITNFSGGEKARLALAKLVWQKPNLLLLDEPTNHLDLEMRSAIELALQTFEGALILISHDRHLLKSTVDLFYLVYNGAVTPFKGDLEDYHDWLTANENKSLSVEKPVATAYKDRKVLQNRLKKIEQGLDSAQLRLSEIEVALGDPTLYEIAPNSKLQTLLTEQKTLRTQQTEFEDEWMMISTQLETN